VTVLKCPCCGAQKKGEFPKEVKAPVQYGINLKAYVIYLMIYQLIPYKRTTDLLENLHALPISEGTLNNILKDFARRIELPIEFIKQQIIDSELAHFDESGLYVGGQRDWLHVAATNLYTFYFHHESRGFEATEAAGILDKFQGKACHDFWKTYYKYEHLLHSLCNAHHMRDLQGLFDTDNLPWSLDMKSFFSASKKIVDAAKEAGKTELDQQLIIEIENQYQQIIDEGYKVIPPPPKREKGQRGPIKKGRARRLLERLDGKREEILDFIYDFSSPFDNNQAERDIRMIKVKQKISGTFRSSIMAKFFCEIRSYISTAIKHGVNVYDAIVGVFSDDIFLYAE
jgi:transposase